jgi:hypothetical protein
VATSTDIAARQAKGIVTSSGKLRFFWRPGSQQDEENQLQRGYRFPPTIIQQAIWLYLPYGQKTEAAEKPVS